MAQKKQTKLVKQIAQLLARGYSPEALAFKLDLSARQLKKLREAGHFNWRTEIPEGYLSLQQAADIMGCNRRTLYQQCQYMRLRHVWIDGAVYTRMEWIEVWRQASKYHKRTRDFTDRVLRPKPAAPSPDGILGLGAFPRLLSLPPLASTPPQGDLSGPAAGAGGR